MYVNTNHHLLSEDDNNEILDQLYEHESYNYYLYHYLYDEVYLKY